MFRSFTYLLFAGFILAVGSLQGYGVSGPSFSTTAPSSGQFTPVQQPQHTTQRRSTPSIDVSSLQQKLQQRNQAQFHIKAPQQNVNTWEYTVRYPTVP